jgi:hypothetical protein
MQYAKHLLTATLMSLAVITGCSKSDDTPGTSTDAFIQVDDKKALPVTQKSDPYNTNQDFSCYLGTTTLDLTQKAGSTGAIIQTILTYVVPSKSNAEIDLAAKAVYDGIGDGQAIKVKILGDVSHSVTPIAGYLLSGSVSATTGVWDYSYTANPDVEMSITKSGTKLQFSVSTPIAISLVKRAGAGSAAYPSFDATTQFSLQMPL